MRETKNKGGRPRLELKVQNSVEDLKRHYRTCTCAVEQRRTQAVWWLAEGRSRTEVLNLSGYSPSSLVSLIKRYNAQGLAGLRDARHENKGAPSLLSDEEMLRLAQVIRTDYKVGRVWDGAKVVTWLREELGKEVYPSRAYEYLAAVGFSRQSPRPSHVKADAAQQEHFKKSPYPKR